MKRRSRQLRLSIAAAAGLIALAGTADAVRGKQTEPASGDVITGRDFAGFRLQITPLDAPLELTAQRGMAWIEPPAAGGGEAVRRLLLQGDVRVRLGVNRFAAARAAVWIEPLEASKTRPGGRLHQIAVYLDRIGDPGADASAAQTGDRLLVTAVVDAEPSLSVDAMTLGVSRDALVIEGEGRFARYLDAVANPGAGGAAVKAAGMGGARSDIPRVSGVLIPGMSQPFEPGSILNRAPTLERSAGPSLADAVERARTPEQSREIFSRTGMITIAAGEPVLMPSNDERVLLVTGGVVMQYVDPAQGRSLQLSAQRAVVFFDQGPLEDLARAPAERVRGIYLEGDVVASDGKFNTRANQVYYDVRANRAMLVEGVFWTYDEAKQLPLYVRAAQIRQTATNQVTGTNVRVAASSFFEPQISLAADKLTITREPASPARPLGRTTIEGRDITARTNGTGFFYWPAFKGDLDRFPLKDVRVQSSSAEGFGVSTLWDLLGILGIDAPEKVRVDLILDMWAKRGFAAGVDGQWEWKDITGSARAYIAPKDRGTDQLASGVRRDRQGETRGFVIADSRVKLDEHWSLFVQGAYFSDENFFEAFDQGEAEKHREFRNELTIRGIEGRGSFAFGVQHNFNDFTANQYLLQSRGYTVSKLPELRYMRVGDDLLSELWPGALHWNHEYRLSRMNMRFTEPSAIELGFDTPALAMAALGITPTMSPGDRLRAMGFIDTDVIRADTRQELSFDYKWNDIDLNPFAVGRFTAWSKRFENVASAGQDDRARLWGAAGLRASTTFQRVYDEFSVPLLDVNRLRHIVTPSVTLWAAGANRSQHSLPTYDELVEGLNEGAAVRAGLAQVFQTKRGGKDADRSVDLLKINADVVISSNDTDKRSPFGRFFDDRPEYAVLGNYATGEFAYALTDALSLTGSTIFDLDLNQQARSTIGMVMQQSQEFSTFVELRFLNPRDATYLAAGVDARLTEVYTLSTQATFDTNKGRVQSVGLRLTREFPALLVAFKVSYNDITRSTSIGFAVNPNVVDRRQEFLVRRLGLDRAERELGIGSGGQSPDIGRTALPGDQ